MYRDPRVEACTREFESLRLRFGLLRTLQGQELDVGAYGASTALKRRQSAHTGRVKCGQKLRRLA